MEKGKNSLVPPCICGGGARPLSSTCFEKYAIRGLPTIGHETADAAGARVHGDIAPPKSLKQRVWQKLYLWVASRPMLYALACELRNLPRRTEYLRKIHESSLHPGQEPWLGLCWEYHDFPTAHLSRCIQRDARTRDTERFWTSLPWATKFETWVFLRGWDAAAEWFLHMRDMSALETAHSFAFLEDALRGLTSVKVTDAGLVPDQASRAYAVEQIKRFALEQRQASCPPLPGYVEAAMRLATEAHQQSEAPQSSKCDQSDGDK